MLLNSSSSHSWLGTATVFVCGVSSRCGSENCWEEGRAGKVSWKSPVLFGTNMLRPHMEEAGREGIGLAAFAPKLGVFQMGEQGSGFDGSGK